MPSESELLELPTRGELGAVSRPAEIWFPRGIDIAEGYLVAVHKPRVLNAEVDAVSGTLVGSALAGATSVILDTTIGFESGDVCTLTDGTNKQRLTVLSVSGQVVSFHAECALKYGFAMNESTLTAQNFYSIMSRMTPHGVGPIIQTQAIECMRGGD